MLRAKLAARLAVCQIVGTFAAILSAFVLGRVFGWNPAAATSSFGNLLTDFLVALFSGLLIGIPFYCIALLILHNATTSILKRPFLWCIAIPAVLLAIAMLTFPPEQFGGIFWTVLIPTSALIAGLTFYAWLWRSPIFIAEQSNRSTTRSSQGLTETKP